MPPINRWGASITAPRSAAVLKIPSLDLFDLCFAHAFDSLRLGRKLWVVWGFPICRSRVCTRPKPAVGPPAPSSFAWREDWRTSGRAGVAGASPAVIRGQAISLAAWVFRFLGAPEGFLEAPLVDALFRRGHPLGATRLRGLWRGFLQPSDPRPVPGATRGARPVFG